VNDSPQPGRHSRAAPAQPLRGRQRLATKLPLFGVIALAVGVVVFGLVDGHQDARFWLFLGMMVLGLGGMIVGSSYRSRGR
jgi:hypothetical protein